MMSTKSFKMRHLALFLALKGFTSTCLAIYFSSIWIKNPWLVYLEKNDLVSRLQWWAPILPAYQHEIKYMKSSENNIAGALYSLPLTLPTNKAENLRHVYNRKKFYASRLTKTCKLHYIAYLHMFTDRYCLYGWPSEREKLLLKLENI